MFADNSSTWLLMSPLDNRMETDVTLKVYYIVLRGAGPVADRVTGWGRARLVAKTSHFLPEQLTTPSNPVLSTTGLRRARVLSRCADAYAICYRLAYPEATCVDTIPKHVGSCAGLLSVNKSLLGDDGHCVDCLSSGPAQAGALESNNSKTQLKVQLS